MRRSRAFVPLFVWLVAFPAWAQAAGQTPSAPAAATEAVLETSLGEIVIRLLPELAPAHVRLFRNTAKIGNYDGTIFHRIIMGGMIQGGDPTTKDPNKAARYGTGGLGILKAEFSERPFVRGTVAAATASATAMQINAQPPHRGTRSNPVPRSRDQPIHATQIPANNRIRLRVVMAALIMG